jgi:peptide/nickel transport system permease protein
MIDPKTKSNLKRELRSSTTAKIGVFLFVFLIVVAIFAPVIAMHDPTEQNLEKSRLPPAGITQTETETVTNYSGGNLNTTEVVVTTSGNLTHPFGTDNLGRDLFSRVVYGTRTSMFVGILGTGISMIIGVSIGLVSGYYRGRLDDILMRFADIMLALPSLIFAIVLLGLFGPRAIYVPDPIVSLGLVSNRPESFPIPTTLLLVIGAVNWVAFARISRGEAISIVNEEHVKSAKALGAGDVRIIRQHILPNSITPIMVYASINIAFVILLEAGLSYLGFVSTTLSWGFDISQGRGYIATAWWIATVPGIAIMLAVFSVNLIGDWLRDSLDPEIQSERQT